MMNILIGLGIGLVAGFIGYSYGLYGSKELVSVEDVDKAIEQAKRDVQEAVEQTKRAIIAGETIKAEYEILTDKYKETKQRLDLYDSLLTDTEIMTYRICGILNDEIMGGYTLEKVYEVLDKIVAEYRALEYGETTGDEEEQYDNVVDLSIYRNRR